MFISKGQLIQLIENLPKSAQVTTYYYLKDMTTVKNVEDDLQYDYQLFPNQLEFNEEKMNWVQAFLEFHLDR